MAKNLKMGLLNQIYGELLTDRQRSVITYYYDDDLSLGEIADNFGITRQGVHDTLTKAEALLREYEDTLHIYARMQEAYTLIAALRERTADDAQAQALLDKLSDVL